MMNYTETNKEIAEFMGMKYYSKSQDGSWYRLREGAPDLIHDSAFEYHTSWKSLMPVVEKIIDYKYDDEPDGTAFLRTFGMKDEHGLYMVRFNRCVLHSAETLLNATYMACLDFIENDMIWHATKTQD